ncbi:MAG: hypothetical protein HW405_856 [Candidatus Berkelbacteria bacterium]|nr:hypothetical protein [Candidatus Berkelbacteria bacterium]
MPRGTKILMVDDDKMLIDLYKERLELAGYHVDISRDGEEGLAMVHKAKPDLVLLDIMMPKVNGYEALASIKSDPATKDIPVIILSALMRDINKSKAVESGADDYIIKSEAMPADVIKKIEAVLKKYNKSAPVAPMPPTETKENEPPQTGASSGPKSEVSLETSEGPSPVVHEQNAPKDAPQAPSQEINFEPASGGQDLSVPPLAGNVSVSPQTPVAEEPPQPQAVPGAQTPQQNTASSVPKASPAVVFFLILIVILILASDLFFYMKFVTGK